VGAGLVALMPETIRANSVSDGEPEGKHFGDLGVDDGATIFIWNLMK
jgi:hypothetical protein